MFNPLGAVSAGYRGFTEGRDQGYEKMGLEALGKAFQQPQMGQGPIDQMNSNPSPYEPMAPSPGQASAPGPHMLGPMAQGPLQQGMPPMETALGAGAQGPMPAPSPQMPPAQAAQPSPQSGPPQQMAQGGAPSAAGQPPSQAGGQGMDLYSLSRRIQMANPNLPPQALVAALTRALPLLNVQAKQQLLDIRRQMYGLSGSQRGRAMDLRERYLDQRDQTLNRPPPEALRALRDGHVTTFKNGQSWTLGADGQPQQVGGEAAPTGGAGPRSDAGQPGEVMSDASPDPVRAGQQYAAANATGDNYLSPDSGMANRIPMGLRVATGTERRPPPQEPDTLKGSYDTARRDAQNTISQGVTDLQGGEPARGANRILHGGLEYILAPGQALSQRFLGRPLDYNMLIPGNAAAAGARAGAERAQGMRSQDSPMERLGPRSDAGGDPMKAFAMSDEQPDPIRPGQQYAGGNRPRMFSEEEAAKNLEAFRRQYGEDPATDGEMAAVYGGDGGYGRQRAARVPKRGAREAAPIGGGTPPE